MKSKTSAVAWNVLARDRQFHNVTLDWMGLKYQVGWIVGVDDAREQISYIVYRKPKREKPPHIDQKAFKSP